MGLTYNCTTCCTDEANNQQYHEMNLAQSQGLHCRIRSNHDSSKQFKEKMKLVEDFYTTNQHSEMTSPAKSPRLYPDDYPSNEYKESSTEAKTPFEHSIDKTLKKTKSRKLSCSQQSFSAYSSNQTYKTQVQRSIKFSTNQSETAPPKGKDHSSNYLISSEQSNFYSYFCIEYIDQFDALEGQIEPEVIDLASYYA